MTTEAVWRESDSELFLRFGRAFTPGWAELRESFLHVIPAAAEERFCCVDIGAGSGWLSEAILHRLPGSQVVALDGSEAMLEHAASRLSAFSTRFTTVKFDLENFSWIEHLPARPRCFVSCLVIHHLPDERKRRLFAALYDALETGGGLLMADLVRPLGETARELYARAWEQSVLQQSRDLFGDARAYEAFVERRWNYYRYPDPMDQPSTQPELLCWFAESGFKDVEVLWAYAGHVLIAGFKKT
ncbi:MAG: 16S rRNA (cytosine(1402)-N(4))-methyltransferase [Candidatus Eremiobacter antarcticus]|nr:class I SAM-dependent methyltransferase [Candidatus Eremiobacteraeota bacterium]MBC5808692.1 class I SAM-dependent methyltransferase [Candidatus Eremiobacteraeota bacterium]PZR62173.1 MAG: 16S rRNA (cytosine(1402)-N(4))-methyltransferase [Candidatus Eremiobacter sp. RRmetagenome_bin22]